MLPFVIIGRFRLRSVDQVAKMVRIGEYYLSKRKFVHAYLMCYICTPVKIIAFGLPIFSQICT